MDREQPAQPAAELGAGLTDTPVIVGPSRRLKIVKARGLYHPPARLVAQWAADQGLIPPTYRIVGSIENPREWDDAGDKWVRLEEFWVRVAASELDEVPEGMPIPAVYLERPGS